MIWVQDFFSIQQIVFECGLDFLIVEKKPFVVLELVFMKSPKGRWRSRRYSKTHKVALRPIGSKGSTRALDI